MSISILATACGDDHDPELGHKSGGAGGVGGVATGGAAAGGAGGQGGATMGGAGGQGGAVCMPTGVADPVLPCDVDAVLESKCRRCHGDPIQNGAPFTLLSWEDVSGEYLNKPIYERMRFAVERDIMPLQLASAVPPVEPLTPEEKKTLLDFLTDCPMPADGVVCP